MADTPLPSVAKYLQNEEVLDTGGAYPPVSEAMMQKLGESINYILDTLELIAVGEIFESHDAPTGGDNHHPVLGANFVLCAGQAVSSSAALNAVYGITTLPDLRGVFYRGRDHGRGKNPQGDLLEGTTQGDDMPSHQHNYTLTYNSLCARTATNPSWKGHTGSNWIDNTADTSAHMFTITLGNYGGNENRPKCVTSHIYIRIN
jgi:microcystin-dependent protein